MKKFPDKIFYSRLKKERKHFFVRAYDISTEDTELDNPYNDDDFDLDAALVGESIGILRITMPPTLGEGDLVSLC